MSAWEFLERCRCTKPGPNVPEIYVSDSTYGFNGLFRIPHNGNVVRCLCSDQMDWQHVSVSVEGEVKRSPRWEIMCYVKSLFWEDEDWVVQFHPARSQYVNCHPACLHLWRYTGKDFTQPVPPFYMVGPKSSIKGKLR